MTALHPSFQPDRWVPPTELRDGYQVAQLMARHGFEHFEDLHRKAMEEPEWFYPAALEFADVPFLSPWTDVADESEGAAFGRWFVGATTNLAWLAATRHVDSPHPAIIWEGDDGEVRTVSFPELDDQVARAAGGLRALGVAEGDVVAMYLPMIPEAVVTMLAAARIGAMIIPCFSGYGAEALAERLRLGGAKVLVTADGLRRRGKDVEMLSRAVTAASTSPTVEHICVVERLGTGAPLPENGAPWDALLSSAPPAPIQPFSVDTPWLLAFTSGSTGRPKGAVHSQGGLPYSTAIEINLSLDVRAGDRFTWPTDMGWLAGPQSTIGPLILGATAVVFEGVMDHPAPNRPWQLVERHGITQYGLAPTTARVLAAAGESWVAPFQLESLRVIASAGEPWTLPSWRWLHQHVGRGVRPIINWSGGTEIGGTIVSGYPVVPTLEGRFSSSTLGMPSDVVDDEGQPVLDQIGELVLRRSWPAMTHAFWQERERYVETYWKRFPGIWVHGDRAIRHRDGSYEVPGRSDDLLKVAGKRVGPLEFESLATDVDGVISAAAVGVEHPTKGQVPLVVVSVAADRIDDESLSQAVLDRIERDMGRPMLPVAVLRTTELPRTRSGKIHRRAVRAWVTGNDAGDLSSLDNAEVAPLLQAMADEVQRLTSS